MTPAERQYRRVLRLLPAGYRQLWEEDMVSAYLDSAAQSPRRSVGEWLSVAWLALRLRLNGSHATPRAHLWYQLVLGIAMLTTLYESLNATTLVASTAWEYFTTDIDASWQNHVAYWWGAASLVWVPIFFCLVLGRLAAARVLVLFALAHEFGLTALVVKYTINPSWWVWPGVFFVYSNIIQAWLLVTAVTVFLVPKDFRPPRRWLAAYVVPAVVIVPIAVASVSGGPEEPTWPSWLQLLQYLNVGTLLHVGTIVGMVVALARARQWLLPLAVFSGGVAAGQLGGHYYGTDFLYWPRQHGSALWTWVNVTQLVLAAACAVAGLVALGRSLRAVRRSPG